MCDHLSARRLRSSVRPMKEHQQRFSGIPQGPHGFPLVPAIVDLGAFPLWNPGTGGPRVTDVRQGDLGDCWVLAVLASLAQVAPEHLKALIEPLAGGRYLVHLDRPIEVGGFIDAHIEGPGLPPAPVYADYRTTAWVAIMEKAIARRKPYAAAEPQPTPAPPQRPPAQSAIWSGIADWFSGPKPKQAPQAAAAPQAPPQPQADTYDEIHAGHPVVLMDLLCRTKGTVHLRKNMRDRLRLAMDIQDALATKRMVAAGLTDAVGGHACAVTHCDPERIDLYDPHGHTKSMSLDDFLGVVRHVTISGPLRPPPARKPPNAGR